MKHVAAVICRRAPTMRLSRESSDLKLVARALEGDAGARSAVAILFLHLLVAAFWIGILTPLRRLSSQEHSLDAAAKLGERFGAFATIAVPVLIIAGVIMTWQLVGSFSAMISTSYGLTLLSKIGTVAVLLGLAAANKIRFVPSMLKGDFSAGLKLSRSIQFEWVAIILILALTAILTSALTLPM